jgi:2-polyprenyl-6-methoxyphenol hydroxylase-like FAD-dependent oxidoreductase
MSDIRGDRAVVLGGSIAGLVAARVLADAYAEVVVVERDELSDAVAHRRGAPQSRHIHGLLAGGQQALEELFDGLTAELVGRGAPAGDMLDGVRVHFGGHRLHRGPSGLLALQASRPMLEASLRARVRKLPVVSFLDRCDVAGLTATSDGSRVTGARLVQRRDGSAEEILTADLVVDATGRGSRTPAWLDMLGYPRPPVERVRVGLGYASRTYRLVPGLLHGDLGVLIAATPERPRGGALAAMEDDRFLVTLFGLGDHPPTDPAGFADFAATLQFPDVHEVLRAAEPLDEPVPFRHPASVRHRYEQLGRFPGGLIVMGDAVCTFNPVYGQGMSVAALQALALRAHLRQHTRPEPVELLRQFGRIVDVPWRMATGGDLAFPEVAGRRTPPMRILNGYLALLFAGAADDPRLGRAFLRVAGLVDPPRALLAPGVAARVLGARRRKGR